MGKNRVWNKGKHNGGGLAKRKDAETDTPAAAAPAESMQEQVNPRIDTVKPMNRSNWVSRPARVAPKDNNKQ